MSQVSRTIPEKIKRVLRKEAAYGCCKCGLPIIEYHHIVQFSKENLHRPELMMVLCPIHHHEATVGAMPEEEQYKLKKEPYNIIQGYTEGQLKVNHNLCMIRTGGCIFAGEGPYIVVNNHQLLGIKVANKAALLSLDLYNEKNELLASIVNNEWISGDVDLWDIESSFQYLKIRSKNRKIDLEIHTNADIISLRADLWKDGQNIKLDSERITINEKLENTGISGICVVGMLINISTESAKRIELAVSPNVSEGRLISEPDLHKTIAMAQAAWEKIKK